MKQEIALLEEKAKYKNIVFINNNDKQLLSLKIEKLKIQMALLNENSITVLGKHEIDRSEIQKEADLIFLKKIRDQAIGFIGKKYIALPKRSFGEILEQDHPIQPPKKRQRRK